MNPFDDGSRIPRGYTTQQRRWHPKLTAFRIIVLGLTISYGVSKAFLSSKDLSTASITVEWLFSVVVTLSLYWLGLYEEIYPEAIPWLFGRDYTPILRQMFRFSPGGPPNDHPDDDARGSRTVSLMERNRPFISGFRLLVTVTTIVFGLAKAALSYQGFSTIPNTFDWLFGVLSSITFYCLGLYERSPTMVMPTLFSSDYFPLVKRSVYIAGRGVFVVLYLSFLVLVFAFGVILAKVAQFGYSQISGDLYTPSDASTVFDVIAGELSTPVFYILLAVYGGVGGVLSLTATLLFTKCFLLPLKIVASYVDHSIGISNRMPPCHLRFTFRGLPATLCKRILSLISSAAFVTFHLVYLFIAVAWTYYVPYFAVLVYKDAMSRWLTPSNIIYAVLNWLFNFLFVFCFIWPVMCFGLMMVGITEGIAAVELLTAFVVGRGDRQSLFIVMKLKEWWRNWLSLISDFSPFTT